MLVRDRSDFGFNVLNHNRCVLFIMIQYFVQVCNCTTVLLGLFVAQFISCTTVLVKELQLQ